MDRYLASLRASAPTYEDPYAYWGGTRPALQYGLPPEQPRPDTAGWPSATTDYGMGHVPAGMPAMGAPPPVVTGPGGPRPSTPTGTTLPQSPFSLQSRYNAAADRARGYNGENGMGRAQRWLNDLYRMATPQEQQDPHFREWAERYAQGGVRWAETHEPGFGPTGFAHDAATPENTYNPGQALAAIRAGQDPAHVQADARGLSVVPGQGGAADPAQRAADHITQALSGGTTGGATMPDQRDPTYHATPNNMGATGVPATGAGGGAPGGGLPDVNAAYLLDPQNRAALQAYIAGRGGVSPSTHSLLGNYIYDTVAPMFASALTSLGLDTPGGMQGNIDQWFQQGRGNTLFSGLRNAAQQRLQSGGFASDLAALGDPRAQAGLLNQLIGLGAIGTSSLHRTATQQQLIDRQRQFELQSALSPDVGQLQNYMTYFQGLPGWDRLVGGGGG